MRMPNNDFSVEDLICDESFQQYCLGATLESQVLWSEWISNHPNRLADIEQAKNIVHILTAKQGSRIQQLKDLRGGLKQREALGNLISVEQEFADLPKAGHLLSIPEKSTYKTLRWYTYMGGAAAAVAVMLFSFYFIQQGSGRIAGLFSEYPDGHSISSGKSPRKTVILADGTAITLAKESTIRLTENFSSGKRELWLSGEAFFDVKHDRSHLLVVHTSYNDIKVLGTTFNVKAYEGSKSMETSLIHGSVRVDSKKYPGYSVTLKPNEKLVTNNDLSKEAVLAKVFRLSALEPKRNTEDRSINDKNTHFAQPQELKWIRNRLDIENEPLSSIVLKLQNWYGIKIIIADDHVKDYRYSGVFENETIIKTLEALQLSYPFEFKVEEERIIISK